MIARRRSRCRATVLFALLWLGASACVLGGEVEDDAFFAEDFDCGRSVSRGETLVLLDSRERRQIDPVRAFPSVRDRLMLVDEEQGIHELLSLRTGRLDTRDPGGGEDRVLRVWTDGADGALALTRSESGRVKVEHYRHDAEVDQIRPRLGALFPSGRVPVGAAGDGRLHFFLTEAQVEGEALTTELWRRELPFEPERVGTLFTGPPAAFRIRITRRGPHLELVRAQPLSVTTFDAEGQPLREWDIEASGLPEDVVVADVEVCGTSLLLLTAREGDALWRLVELRRDGKPGWSLSTVAEVRSDAPRQPSLYVHDPGDPDVEDKEVLIGDPHLGAVHLVQLQ